jgi:lipopolysaccharide/colanic/teichoic acid biosynthesis glycosyltransferase
MFNAPHGFYLTVTKPILDRVLASLGIILLSPVIAVISAGVLVSSGRPIFFRQQRVGKDGRRFDIVKFRTMEPDRRRQVVPIDHPDRRKYHKSADDPRHTSFGRLLRRFSLDELPQLINIVRGDMSLVGPRPELPDIVEQYEPWQHLRHLVRPGLTGPWQISARGDGPMHEFAHLDLQYISELSLRGDLAILSKTVPALITHQGH